jgi:hypothetical protein
MPRCHWLNAWAGSFDRVLTPSGPTGASARRSALRTPEGMLSPSIFNPTPRGACLQPPALDFCAGAASALCGGGPSRAPSSAVGACTSPLPGAAARPVFQLAHRAGLPPGKVPEASALATDGGGQPVLCVLSSRGGQLLAFQLHR